MPKFRWLRDDPRAAITALIVAFAMFALQFAGVIVFLDRYKNNAAKEAITRVQLAAGEVQQGVRRQMDALGRLSDDLTARALATPSDSREVAFIDQRLRRLIGDPRYAIASVTLLGAEPAADWHSGTGPQPYDAATLATLRGAALAPGQIHIDAPDTRTEPGNWFIPLYFGLYSPAGESAGLAVIVLDGRRIAAILADLEGRRGQFVGLWRSDGMLLASSINALDGIARNIRAPLTPGPDGRAGALVHVPLLGGERFLAARVIAEHTLFFTVSSARDYEMADYDYVWRFAMVLELALLGLTIGAAALHLALRSRARVRRDLLHASSEQAHFEHRHAELQHVLDGVDAGLYRILVSPDNKFTRYYYNSGTARLVRRTVEEVSRTTTIVAYAEPPLDPEVFVRSATALREHGVASHEAQLRCGDGELRWMRFQVRVVGHVGDKLDCVALVTDIELERAAAAASVLSARLATLGELSAGIAHEMKQPLTAISLITETTELLLTAEPPAALEGVVRSLHRINAMVRRATTITEHLRGIARRQEEGLQPFDIRAAIDGALLMCGAAMRSAQMTVAIDVPEDIPAAVGHLVLVEQVLMNLMMNARDAFTTQPPSITPFAVDRRLFICATTVQGELRLRVRDNGPGIPPHVMPRLFEAFFTTKPPGAGTGLGLSICASILKACGGDISAANVPEGGAEFTLRLVPADAPADAIA